MPNENDSSRELLRSAMQRTADCPPVPALERLLDGANPGIAEHVQSCSFCGTEVALLKSFRTAEVPPEDAAAVNAIAQRLRQSPIVTPGKADEPRKSWWRFGGSWLQPAVLAAAAVLVLAAVGLQLRHNTPPELRHTGNQPDVFRSQSFTILAPAGELQKSPEEVRWEPAPSASAYRVRLLEVDGHELWSAQTVNTSVAFPPAVRALIVPTKTLMLAVTALDARGQKIAESDNTRFQVLQNVYPH